ncbi:hypothetical protein [Metallosphaera tengchongensis]|uniref:hypothetical protein n=1 Tax=Metallosphaera tengchongensis TaxID=1532350 RepID=UPI00157BF667|nr:hypothetical protein [Metallosphaera tengchongensis]
MSKSYFYLMLDRIRDMGLVIDNGIAFKAALSFSPSGEKLELENKILYVTDNRELIVMDLESDDFTCKSCPIRMTCVNYLKTVAKELNFKLYKDNPREAWKDIMSSLRKVLVERTPYLKVSKLPLDSGRRKDRDDEANDVIYSCISCQK